MSRADDPSRIDPIKGRGTPVRIAHRYERDLREAVDDGWEAPPGEGEPPPPATFVTEERARTVISRNDSPDIPFDIALNPYRGCEHGCIYCYARPTHSYLDLSPGLDFETRLVAKVNVVERLRAELSARGHVPSPINIGSATDAYQPIERRLRLTRGVLELLTACEHPFTLVTKSAGIERDLDLIAPAARRRQALVFVSVTTLDAGLARRLEPRATTPLRRLQAVRRLAEAGVPVGVNVAPIIPFVNEPEIERIVEAAAAHGAHSIHYTVLRLPWEVAPLFRQWLDQHLPDRAGRVMARVQDMRGGKDYDADYASRMKGAGLWAELIRQRVLKAAARHGLSRETPALDRSRFRPPAADAAQHELFG
ncbi:PA0069 family radical SAM protein [uncultured Methylibium sp.]|uniref:PA0069 family radical SAM protein n=1 Tax=uncultured Methylibium sp. TaxID=381093 RepID=UPI0025D263E9|nr:PA0069 family radical SAM protein [uncultured Methylibium sp.]